MFIVSLCHTYTFAHTAFLSYVATDTWAEFSSTENYDHCYHMCSVSAVLPLPLKLNYIHSSAETQLQDQWTCPGLLFLTLSNDSSTAYISKDT